MGEATLRVYRGDRDSGVMADYRVPVEIGMVVLDAILHIQGHIAPDLAARWNCKAGRCGSCSAEINGRPRLLCKARMDEYPAGQPIEVRAMRAFPLLKDLVTDVSWNYDVNRRIQAFTPEPGEPRRIHQQDVDRVQEFRKCIECFLCQDVCHVLRDHEMKNAFIGPRFLVRVAGLEMHPGDTADRLQYLRREGGIGLCNITKCCTEVCPEGIRITDNAIIPLKERVVTKYYDPVAKLISIIRRK